MQSRLNGSKSVQIIKFLTLFESFEPMIKITESEVNLDRS